MPTNDEGGPRNSRTAFTQPSVESLLFDEHRRELLEGSAIDPDVAAERGYYTASRPNINDQRPREELAKAGIPSWATGDDWNFPGLVIPLYRATGERAGYQFKPRSPVADKAGRRMKYASARGVSSVLDVHPRWSRDRGRDDPALLPFIKDVHEPLYIVEGVKKADSMTSRGLCTIGLNGVYNWRDAKGSLGDWEDVPLRGRRVTVVFDADARDKRGVLQAMKRVGRWLKSRGATPSFLIPPARFNGVDTKGVDDYFAAGGTWEELKTLISSTAPEQLDGEDRFTESAIAEDIAAALEGRFCRVPELGWMSYNGSRWVLVDDAAVQDAVRLHTKARYLDAIDAFKAAVQESSVTETAKVEQDGWHKYQSASKVGAVVRFLGGIETMMKSASDFDADPDVLNTPAGLLRLESLELEPHSPDHLCTRITAVSYHPGAHSAAFKTALCSLPDDAHDWLQLRLGQAVTGYEPDDEKMVMFSGEGQNGKTALLGTLNRALGYGGTGYAALVPSELLLMKGSAGGPSPEKMELRGVRLAYMEETPEGRYLDINVLKQVVGTGEIIGRKLYKDLVAFKATHSLILNTNHPPIVNDTDSATWRRLIRVDFPYRFRMDGDEERLGPWRDNTDRAGDPGLKRQLDTIEARAAALAWLVEGARRWYEGGRTLRGAEPASVQRATSDWRKDTDQLIGYFEENMVVDPNSWTWSTTLFHGVSKWLEANGHRPWAMKLFIDRLKYHTGLPGRVEIRRMRAGQAGFSKPRNQSVSAYAPKGGQGMAVVGFRFIDQKAAQADDWEPAF